MSTPEELLKPLKVVLGELVSFAHERFGDAIRLNSTATDMLRLVSAAEAFQTLAAVQQISQAVNNLERLMGDISWWSKEADQLSELESAQLDPASLKLPRSLLMASTNPVLSHGFWEGDTEYALEWGEHRIELTVAGPDQVAAPQHGIVLDVAGGPAVLGQEEWAEICMVVSHFMSTSAPPTTKEVGGEK